MPIAQSPAKLWPLDGGVVFLNHGSFGACPTEVLRHQAALRAEMEAEPVRFLSRELDDRLDAARRVLAAFVAADPDDLALVVNATSGVNVYNHRDHYARLAEALAKELAAERVSR